MAQARADEMHAKQSSRAGSSTAAQQQDQGYWNYMQNQLNERTKNLGIMGDSVNKLEESSANWADQASKFVSTQKKNMILGGKFHY